MLSPGAMVISRPGLSWTMSGFMVLLQSGSVLKSKAHVAAKGYMEVRGQAAISGLLVSRGCASTQSQNTIRAQAAA